MRILLVSAEYPPETGSGGIGTYVANLAPALARLGHRVTVLSRAPDGAASSRDEAGVRVVRVADREPPAGFFRPPFSASQAARAAEHYRRAYSVAMALLQREDLGPFDVAEAPDWAGEAALLAAARPELPYVIKFHTPARLVFGWNDPSIDAGFVDALHALETVAVANAGAWSCPSAWMGGACEELFGLPRGSVRRLPNPFDAGPYTADPSVDGVERDPRQLLYLGRLESRKGVLELAPALAGVLTALPDASLRLVGADTSSAPGGASVRRTLLARLPPHLHGRIHFAGHADRAGVARALARAGVVVLPSRRENFPYTCLEAMAAGAAVVASRHGGMAEMIESGRSGLLVDPGDAAEVHDALLRLLLQPRVARQLGAAAREHVVRAYAPEALAEEHAALYREVIDARRQPVQPSAPAVPAP